MDGLWDNCLVGDEGRKDRRDSAIDFRDDNESVGDTTFGEGEVPVGEVPVGDVTLEGDVEIFGDDRVGDIFVGDNVGVSLGDIVEEVAFEDIIEGLAFVDVFGICFKYSSTILDNWTLKANCLT